MYVAHTARPLDWSKYHRRYIALEFFYLGAKFTGLAWGRQVDDDSVEVRR